MWRKRVAAIAVALALAACGGNAAASSHRVPKSSCSTSLRSRASPTLQQPVRFSAGARAMIAGQPFMDPLPFRTASTDIVVVHNLSYSIAAARCAR